MLSLPDREGMAECCPCTLGCVALAPMAAREVPAQLKAGRGGRLPKADHADKRSARFLLRHPYARSFKLPVPDRKGHVPPSPAPVPGLPAADEAHDLGVRVEGGVVLEVAAARPPEPQALGHERWDFGCLHASAPPSSAIP